EELEVTARETNGIVQAIERKGHPFYLGVQFHPELLIYRKVFRKLFRRFVKTAAKVSEESSH
ncbi:MAG: gamma-glutamyl-gamma-aminobutyrate hydrolase family protein, partial [Bacteroidota bacterium]